MSWRAERFIWGADASGSNYRIRAYHRPLSNTLQEIEQYVSLNPNVLKGFPIGTTSFLHGILKDRRHIWVRSKVVDKIRGSFYRASGCVLDHQTAQALRGDWFLLDSLLPPCEDRDPDPNADWSLHISEAMIKQAAERTLGQDWAACSDPATAHLLASLAERHRSKTRRTLVLREEPSRAAGAMRSLLSCLPPKDRLNLSFTTAAFQYPAEGVARDLVFNPLSRNQLGEARNKDVKRSILAWLHNLREAKHPPYMGLSALDRPDFAARFLSTMTDETRSPLQRDCGDGLSIASILDNTWNQVFPTVRRHRLDARHYRLLQELELALAQDTTLEELVGRIEEYESNHNRESLKGFGLRDLAPPPLEATADMAAAVRVAVGIFFHMKGEDPRPFLEQVVDPTVAAGIFRDEMVNTKLRPHLVRAWLEAAAHGGLDALAVGKGLLDQLASRCPPSGTNRVKWLELALPVWNAVCSALGYLATPRDDSSLRWYRTVTRDYRDPLLQKRLQFAMVRSLYGKLEVDERCVFHQDYLSATRFPESDKILSTVAGQSIKKDPYLLWGLIRLLGRAFASPAETGRWDSNHQSCQWDLISRIIDGLGNRPEPEIQEAGSLVVSLAMAALRLPDGREFKELAPKLVGLLVIALGRPLPVPELALLPMLQLVRLGVDVSPLLAVWPNVRQGVLEASRKGATGPASQVLWPLMVLDMEDQMRHGYRFPRGATGA